MGDWSLSSDQDPTAMKSWFSEMGDWVAYKFGEGKHLTNKYDIHGIPTLVVINAKNGEVITKNGRSDVNTHREKAVEEWMLQCQSEK